LTPEGRRRVDELLDERVVAGRNREWVVRFAIAREAEVDAGRTDDRQLDDREKLSVRNPTPTTGRRIIRDQGCSTTSPIG
jgi:hypothetical protein